MQLTSTCTGSPENERPKPSFTSTASSKGWLAERLIEGFAKGRRSVDCDGVNWVTVVETVVPAACIVTGYEPSVPFACSFTVATPFAPVVTTLPPAEVAVAPPELPTVMFTGVLARAVGAPNCSCTCRAKVTSKSELVATPIVLKPGSAA